MINETRLFANMRKLFTGDVHEIMGELIQNAQRAQATEFLIHADTQRGTVTFEDNGTGLEGAAGFRVLLRIGDSYYQDPDVETEQNPLGMGINALLAHEKVTQVTVESGRYRLAIDTTRWWTDTPYREAWESRLERTSVPVTGVRFIVQARPGIGGFVANVTEIGANMFYRGNSVFRRSEDNLHPGAGYGKYLAVGYSEDGGPLRWLPRSLPNTIGIPDAPIQTTYQGCPLRISFAGSGHVWINHFGQLIRFRSQQFGIAYADHGTVYLEIDGPSPLDFKAPSRQELIVNDRFKAFWQYAIDQIYVYLNDTPVEELSPKAVEVASGFDYARFRRESPVAVLREIVPLGNGGSVSDAGETWPGYEDAETTPDCRVVRVADLDHYTVMNDDVYVGNAKGTYDNYEYGLRRFAAVLAQESGTWYSLGVHPDQAEEFRKTLYWNPGPADWNGFSTKTGTWTIAGDGEDFDRVHWFDFPAGVTDIFAVKDPCQWALSDGEFAVATTNVPRFLENWRLALWSEDEDDPEDSQESFEASCNAVAREYLGNVVKRDFTTLDLETAIGSAKNGEIASVQYHYKTVEGHTQQGTYQVLTAITVTTVTGYSKRFTFYG